VRSFYDRAINVLSRLLSSKICVFFICTQTLVSYRYGNIVASFLSSHQPFYGHYTGQPALATPPVKNWRFCWSKVLLFTCPRWRQLAHSDWGEDAEVLFSGDTCTVSLPSSQAARKRQPQVNGNSCCYWIMANAKNRRGWYSTAHWHFYDMIVSDFIFFMIFGVFDRDRIMNAQSAKYT